MTQAPDTDLTTKSPPEKLSLSFTQILGSVFAAVSATFIASFFGVAGTVIGAALGSLVSVVGSAVYTHSMNRTRDRIRTATIESAVAHRFGRGGDIEGDSEGETAEIASRIGWPGLDPRRVALSAGALFVLVLGGVTAFELASGQPLSSTVTAKQGTGTSLGGGRSTVHSQPSFGTTARSTVPPSKVSSAASVGTSATPSSSVPTNSSAATSSSSAANSPAPTSTPTAAGGTAASSSPAAGGTVATSAPSPTG